MKFAKTIHPTQLKQLYLPTVEHVHHQWLLPLLSNSWLQRCMKSRHAKILLTQKMYHHYQIPLPDKDDLGDNQHWLLLELEQQNELAKNIGGIICLPLLRTVIDKQSIRAVKTQLGKKCYLTLLQSTSIGANGINQPEFDQHLARGSLKAYFIAVGIAALKQTLDPNATFFSLRMKFAFPRFCWKIQPALDDLDMLALASYLQQGENLSSSKVVSDE